MKTGIAVAMGLMFSAATFAADAPRSYAEAKAMWLKSRDSAEYQSYSAEFLQFNNHFHLDEKDDCYGLAPGPVEMMLVITHPDDGEYAVIERVLFNADNAKSRCFRKSYQNVPTKVPPYLPFVLQMHMS